MPFIIYERRETLACRECSKGSCGELTGYQEEAATDEAVITIIHVVIYRDKVLHIQTSCGFFCFGFNRDIIEERRR